MTTDSKRIINVGVLGATGTVGQRFLILLSNHPNFKLIKIGASKRSSNQTYQSIVKWKQTVPIPQDFQDLVVSECDPKEFDGCEIIFSGLDSDVSEEIETKFRLKDFPVFSNSKSFRRDGLCPLVVPLVNPDHLHQIPYQRSQLTSPSYPITKGFIVTNANCSTTGLVVVLKALESSFGPIEKVRMTTFQAISGGGYPGVSSLDILDNVIPYIEGEEEKIQWETQKILGNLSTDQTEIILRSNELQTSCNHTKTNRIDISVTTTRVPVLDGHLSDVSVSFKNKPIPSIDEIQQVLKSYRTDANSLQCFSAPQFPIFVHHQIDRPQPRLDRYFQNGSGINIGRIRKCEVLDIKFIILTNNVSIGAATSSIMNAELTVAKGLI
ncbi:uncharacterized protein MELLADRAFT_50909 [Melampsora larici-populina 98AG31]|uniref:Aspartate-semialdehyde dehydrogenase n=1 Tax=Melampsora larici-populina (strain 98AG31 / pathotype 3-4-7) TaxID=747676 RepID=F4S9G2_MELLP|nr:uncharacterized protein MELLADRAFT_50909 [Melampsora larici-populina 98AG31]EGF98735.1 hypothetical protein MELLADRAFT_50909 [Melampsora larici-populina 98AG31]